MKKLVLKRCLVGTIAAMLCFCMLGMNASFAASKKAKTSKSKKVTMSVKDTQIGIDETTLVSAKVAPSKASQKVVYSVNNRDVAKVSSKGVVTGLRAGTVKVTAASKTNPKIKTSKTITVLDLTKAYTNTADRTITIYARVNGDMLNKTTHHFVVNKNGTNGPKAVLQSELRPAALYEALVKQGLKPGDNLGIKPDKGSIIEGDKVDITVAWDENGKIKKVPMAECVKTQDGTPYKTDMRFGGNIKTSLSKEWDTGCVTCTFSCWIGIVSNASYGYGTADIISNGDVLPAGGTLVKVIYHY